MDVDEILEALKAIIDAAEGRSLTDEEVTNYERLEAQLATAQRSQQIRARQKAYETPVGAHIHVGTPKVDDELDRAFNHYLRTGMPNADIAGLRVTNEQGVGTAAAGGYLVPEGFRQKLVERRLAYGGLAAEVDSFSTDTGNPLEYPSLDDTSNTGGITAENAAVTSGADLAFGTIPLGSYKYTSAGTGSNLPLRVSVELLQDSAFDVQSLIARKMGERIALAQAAHWCTGNGVGQPMGLVASSLTADNELDTPDTIDYDDLLDTEDLLDPEYEPNAKWVMRKNTWTQIRGIVDGAQRPLIFDSAASGIGGRPEKTLLGYPVVIDQQMPALSSAADGNCIAFGDFREAYVIRRVSQFVLAVDPYTRMANGQVQYMGWERADGNIQNRNAYVICQNNT